MVWEGTLVPPRTPSDSGLNFYSTVKTWQPRTGKKIRFSPAWTRERAVRVCASQQPGTHSRGKTDMHTDVVIVGGGMAGCAVAAVSLGPLPRLGPRIGCQCRSRGGPERRHDSTPWTQASRLASRSADLRLPRRPVIHPHYRPAPALCWGWSATPSLHDAVAHLRARRIAVETINPRTHPLLRDSPVAAAWSLPDERVTTGPHLAAHLLARARRNGAEVHTSTEVVRLRIEGGRCIGVETKTQCIDLLYTVLAAGAWSGLLARHVGLSRPLIPLRRAAAHIRRRCLRRRSRLDLAG